VQARRHQAETAALHPCKVLPLSDHPHGVPEEVLTQLGNVRYVLLHQ
jgi:hypothetical protein